MTNTDPSMVTQPSKPRRAPAGAAVKGSGPQPGGAYRAPEAEALLKRAMELIDQARPMPLSASSMINKEEILPLLQQALAALPEELRAARWLLKEREDHLARMRQEGEEILAAARTRAEQMVQRTEVTKMAGQRAQKVVNDAEDRARQLKLETEDWCDQRLGGIEGILQKSLRAVATGRARMQGTERTRPAPEPPSEEPPEKFFDQDAG
jgi:hypothetical protein